MAAPTFEKIVDILIEQIEKGFVDRPTKEDPGGPTNYGITLDTLRAWRDDPTLNRNALMVMPKSEAKEIYKVQYWDGVRGDDLPAGLDWALFDFAVNSGVGRAILSLQEVLGVKQDAIIGVKTMRAIKNYMGTVHKLIADLSEFRLNFMKGLSNWKYNKNGWTRRVKKVMSEAQTLRISSAAYRPDMGQVTRTPKANAENVSVSKALNTKESAAILTVAIPSISGLLLDYDVAQSGIAGFVAAAAAYLLYWAAQRKQKAAI